jgi:mycothiol synthase
MGAARPARLPQDRERLERLFEAARAADGHPPVGEHRPGSGEVQPTASLIEAGGEVISYSALTKDVEPGWWILEIVIDPAWRERVSMGPILEAAIAEVGGRGGKGLRLWTHLSGLAASAESEGFRLERELHRMEMRIVAVPDPGYPPGITVDRFRPGDEDELIEVNNRAFAGSPEGSWDRPGLAERMSQAWFDPDDIVTARGPADLVGFCWVKRSNWSEGEIYVVAVAPPLQGKGIGRALVLEGLRLMTGKGAAGAFLYVEGGNLRARKLYDSLGFSLDHIDRSLVREL